MEISNHIIFFLFFLMIRRPPRSTLFPTRRSSDLPSPSPTITRAVKLKRRPPLTTLDTRLMATTRSIKLLFSAGAPPGPRPPSRRSRRSLPPPAPPPRRCGPGIRRPSRSGGSRCSSSEVQPTLAGAVGQRRNAALVPVATPVEHDRGDAGGLGALGHQGADPAGQRRSEEHTSELQSCQYLVFRLLLEK